MSTQEARPKYDTILVVDFGAQYAQLIARRVRELRCYSEIVPRRMPVHEMLARKPKGIILSGGPESVHVEGAPSIDPAIYDAGIPILGICYGAQLIAQQLGGEVRRTGTSEYGPTTLNMVGVGSTVLFKRLPASQSVWMSHGDSIVSAPEGFVTTATTEASPVAAFEDIERGILGVQFHPEVAHTPRGMEILEAFLFQVCGSRRSWTHLSIIEDTVKEIQDQVGANRVLCALSGGVDSAVAAALVHKAIGDQLTCVFVDTGLLRQDEPEQVHTTFVDQFKVDLVHRKEADRFLDALGDETDPEAKRKIIGTEFIRVFEDEARNHNDARFLVQGTLYPDVVESGGGDHETIKSHHNVGGLPDDMAFDLVEPLKHLFKDEVRAIGVELGLPERIVQRQPFPGPGLAVRIVGPVTRENVETVRAADHIVNQELRRSGDEKSIWQSFAVLLADVRSVGVKGDARSYEHPIVVRAVTSEDAMTADFARPTWEALARISSRIVNEVPRVNRVTYDVTPKPPGTIEWE